MNTKELLAGYKLHHHATMRGYNRVSDYGRLIPYKGRFGQGFRQFLGRHNGSTQYMVIAYWIAK